MCRLGFVSSDKELDMTNLLMVSSIQYGNYNDDGFGFAWKDKDSKIKLTKTERSAPAYWLQHKIDLVTTAMIMHCRKSTSGKLDAVSSHPFVSEDKKYMLVYNGILYDYEEARKYLKSKGHKFASDVDSEVLLHGWEEWKNDFLKELGKLKCRGSVNVIILEDCGQKEPIIRVYSEMGSIVLYEQEGMLMAFSDKEILGDWKENMKNLEKNTLYEIQGGKVIKSTDIGELYELPLYVPKK